MIKCTVSFARQKYTFLSTLLKKGYKQTGKEEDKRVETSRGKPSDVSIYTAVSFVSPIGLDQQNEQQQTNFCKKKRNGKLKPFVRHPSFSQN